MKNRKAFVFGKWYFRILTAMIGIALFVFIFISSTRADMETTEKQLLDTVNYIKKQCATYNSLNLASETKSLMRVMQITQQVNHDIQNIGPEISQDNMSETVLKEYAREHYITGILVLDS